MNNILWYLTWKEYFCHPLPHLVVVEELMCLNEPDIYAGDSIAIRRVIHAGQVKGDKTDEKRYLVEIVTIFHSRNCQVTMT